MSYSTFEMTRYALFLDNKTLHWSMTFKSEQCKGFNDSDYQLWKIALRKLHFIMPLTYEDKVIFKHYGLVKNVESNGFWRNFQRNVGVRMIWNNFKKKLPKLLIEKEKLGRRKNILINKDSILENCCTGAERMSHLVTKYYLQSNCLGKPIVICWANHKFGDL